MSLRSSTLSAAKTRLTRGDDRFVLSIGRRERSRKIALPAGVFYALTALLPIFGAIYLGATGYLFFRDDMIAALMARQARQQYAYEDRLAGLRLQIDRITGRQMLEQDTFDGKLREMISRQARIETRAAVIASLDEVVTGSTDAGPMAGSTAAKTSKPSATVRGRALPNGVEASAPTEPSEPAPMRPRPEDTGLRPSADASGTDVARPGLSTQALALADIASDEVPAQLRVGTLNHAIEKIERRQIAALRKLEAPAMALASKLRAAISATGLTPERLKIATPTIAASAVGGPFVPVRVDARGSEFEAQLSRTQAAVLSLDAIRRVMPTLPLRKPLAGTLETTSTFGYRLDPFLGRPALHSGLDFRGEYGSPVRATAGGTVVSAGWSGGYGNMVEIEHGNGVSTRYGHLSAILVAEGQLVQPGATVGKLGSTGRSTGNHLHYEVRIDDDAVDPTRFIRAASMLAAD